LLSGGIGRRRKGPIVAQRISQAVTGIADTGFLVAFANRNDRRHAWAVEVASRVDEALLTCDAVLAETAFHLESAALVLAMVREGLVLPRACRSSPRM
jgi:hypothetical protein